MANHNNNTDDDTNERPTESTPLVLRRSSSLPPLHSVVNRIRLHGVRTVDEDPSLFLAHPASLAQQISFKIIVLSQLYILAKAPSIGVGADLWEQWSRERAGSLDAEDLQRRIVGVWEEFLEVSRSTQEIEECLWFPFPLEAGKPLTVRVVDILKDPDAPPALVSHHLISLSLSQTWTRGRTFIPSESVFRRILQRVRSAATPRVMHAVDILLQLAYLALLSNYVLHPPERPIISAIPNPIGAREVLLMIYSTASLLRPPITLLVAPFALVAGAFLFALPSVPFPGDVSYSILLGAFLLHILSLHLPRTPSPIFLLSPEITLPLATLLWHELTRTLYPCVLLFLPATVLASLLLSVVLEDSIPHLLTALTLVEPAPMEVRLAFSVLWIIVILLMTISAILLVIFSASLLPTSFQLGCLWDRYSAPVGLRSRRIFVAVVTAYSVPYCFPPPFNLLQILFVHIPHLLLRLFGWKEIKVTGHMEPILWYLTTAPLALVVGVCWLWAGLLPFTPSFSMSFA